MSSGYAASKDCEHRSDATKVKQATAAGGDRLVVTGARAEVVAKLVIASTEPLGGSDALEAPHTSNAAFNAAMILFKSVVFVSAGAVDNAPAKRRADRPRVRAVAVHGDLARGHTSGGLC
jgi:hypothetical protein